MLTIYFLEIAVIIIVLLAFIPILFSHYRVCLYVCLLLIGLDRRGGEQRYPASAKHKHPSQGKNRGDA